MNKENITLESIYEGFLKERKKHLSDRWSKIYSYIKRTFGLKSEFLLLLSSEDAFHTKMFIWVSGHISSNELDVEQVKNTRISLKLFKEELMGRYGFLILFIILLSLSSGFYAQLGEILGVLSDPLIFIVNGTFALLAVIERGNVIKHITYCSQLDLLLEKWVGNN